MAGEVVLTAHAEHEQLGPLLLDHLQQDVGDVVLGGLLAEGDAHGGAAELVTGDLELLLVGVAGVLLDACAQHVDHHQRPAALLGLLACRGQRLEAHLGGDESDDDGHLLSWLGCSRATAATSVCGLVRSYWSRDRAEGPSARR